MDRRTFLAAGAALALPALPVRADGFPERPLRLLQGFAAGGNADTIARVVGAELGRRLGQPLVVETQAGAGGTIAATTVSRARPDGYTLLLATGGHAVAGALYKHLPYRSVDSFAMISTLTRFPFLVVTRADSGYRGLPDLLAAARAAPGALAFGSAGTGSTHHLAGELLASMAGVSLLHVPYRGDAASLTALLSRDVPFIIAPPTAVIANIKAGKARALAVTGAQRWSGLPDVPTVAEQGVAGYDVHSWSGLLAPAGTPAAVIERLHDAAAAALQVDGVRARLAETGGEASASTPEEMKAMLTADLRKWTQVVAAAKIPQQ